MCVCVYVKKGGKVGVGRGGKGVNMALNYHTKWENTKGLQAILLLSDVPGPMLDFKILSLFYLTIHREYWDGFRRLTIFR